MPIGICLKDRTNGGIELGVHQHDVLAVPESLQRHSGAEFDRTGDIDEHVDMIRPRDATSRLRQTTGFKRNAASSNSLSIGHRPRRPGRRT